MEVAKTGNFPTEKDSTCTVSYQQEHPSHVIFEVGGAISQWAGFFAFLIGLVITMASITFSRLGTEYVALTVIAIAAFLFIFGYAVRKLFGRGKPSFIIMSERRIVFKDGWENTLLARESREWSDIHSVDCTVALSPAAISKWDMSDGAALILDFKSGGSVLIELGKIARKETENILLAIEKWADQSVMSKRALLLERGLAAVDSSIAISYTSIWTDALETQFSATNFMPLRTAATLQDGRYEIRMQLASGGLSAVYLAKTKTGERVVIKEAVLPLDIDDKTKRKAKELFEREGRLLSKLSHPQIAKVYDFFVESGRDYIVLEFVPGASLRQYFNSNSFKSIELLVDWAIQILRILEYLHALEPAIIHRDITPDNLLAAENGEIVLIDFGVSNEFLSKATGTMVGKQSYIPPEQFRGKAEPKSDIYSFGATLFFLLTGEEPIPLSVSSPKTLMHSVPEELNEIVVQCTQIEPDTRPTASEAIAMCESFVASMATN